MHGLHRKPLWPQLAMFCKPLSHFSRSLTHVADVRFNIDGALIPECQTIIIDYFERIVGQIFGWIRRGFATDMITIF